MRRISLDFETHLIGAGAVHPKPVVLSVCTSPMERGKLYIGEDIPKIIQSILATDLEIANTNLAFDQWVSIKEWPELYAPWHKAISEGRCIDLGTADKLIQLRGHGGLEFKELPDGSVLPMRYSQAAMVERWLSEDVSADKSGEDVWRTRYSELDGVPLDEWPEEARDYAERDPQYVLRVLDAMGPRLEEVLENRQIMTGLTKAAFVCAGIQNRGMRIDKELAQSLFDETKEMLVCGEDEMITQLEIYIPEVPARPGRNKEHVEGCSRKDCNCPRKMLVPQPSKIATKKLREYVLAWVRMQFPDRPLPLTPKGMDYVRAVYSQDVTEWSSSSSMFDENPGYIKVDKATLKALVRVSPDPVIDRYLEREDVAKLHSSFFPKMRKAKDSEEWADRVHFNFDVLKRTGRMSSFASSLYPSANGQQVEPRIRPIYVADPGCALVFIDYKSMELFAAASKWKAIFGQSALYDLLLDGKDPHAALGASLWRGFDPECPLSSDLTRQYDQFTALEADDPDVFKYWRTFAKPVGLGFPGGLGPETMVALARGYGLDLTLDDTQRAREIWMGRYPEAREWLRGDTGVAQLEYEEDVYGYVTRQGMVRAGCSYTAAANGCALQSDPAEMIREVVWQLETACNLRDNPLLGSSIVNVVHDEVGLQCPLDENETVTAAVMEAERIMVQVASAALDIPMQVESEVFYRWYKKVPPELRERGISSFDSRRPVDPLPKY